MRQPIAELLCILLFAPAIAMADTKQLSIGEAAQNAVAQSKLTSPGSYAFHLKAKIAEKGSPDSDYKAEVEEYWISPEKWRRTIHSPDFSQTVIHNGDKVFEEDMGDYYPYWLRDLVTAIFDPLPMLEILKKSSVQIPKPNGSESSTSCARFQTTVGIPPAQTGAFFVYCFEGSHGLLSSVVTPGYDALFQNYKPFTNKRVARRIVIDPEPGTTIEADVLELTELKSPDETLFAIQEPTAKESQLESVYISEATLRGMSVNAPDIVWPSVRSGKTSGVLSMYISVDRNGQVREAWPLNSDNAGLDDPAREQVRKWGFKPARVGAVPVQIESIVTFAFNTKTEDPIPVLSDAEARQLATKTAEPAIPPGNVPRGTSFTVRVSVDPDGKILGFQNVNNLPTALFLAATNALDQWRFQSYLRNGKRDFFHADITFHVH